MTEPGPLFCCTVITPQPICLSLERAGLLIVCKCPKSKNYTLQTNWCVSQLGSKDTKSQGRAETPLLGVKPVFLAPSLVPSHVPLWQLPGTAGLGTALGRSVCQAGKGDAMALCSHLTDLWCIRQDGEKQWCWKWQLGVLVSKRDYSLSVNPFPFKLSWNGTLVAGHYRSSWKVCVFLAKCVCVPEKASLCCLLLFNPSVCDGFQGHPSAVSFTGFSLWHCAELVPSVLWGSLLLWKREGNVCGFPTSSISKPCSQDTDAVGEYNLSLPFMLPLSHRNSAKVLN